MTKGFALVSIILGIFITPLMAEAQSQIRNTLSFSSPSTLKNGKIALKNGEINKAIAYLKRSIKNGLSEDFKYSANNHLCVAYYLKEDFKKALEHCNTAIRSASNQWEAYNNRGNIHLASGKYILAIKDYKKGLKLKKSSIMLQANLEIAFRRQNRITVPGKFIPARKKPKNFGRNLTSVAD